MFNYKLPYGNRWIDFSIGSNYQVDVILPEDTPAAEHPQQLVRAALSTPLGDGNLENFLGAQSVAIAINDKTRPVPHQYLLPPLLERLEALGFKPNQILLLIATGTHIPMQPEEFSQVLPDEIIRRYPVVSHDCDDQGNLAHFGISSKGTPITINRLFSQADLRIVVGNIEPHHFMGFSGGVKSAIIGLGGRDTININHTMLIDPNARIAEYENNPTRQDIEEIGEIVGVHFALNAILNQQREIVHVLAGSPLEVMHQGISLARKVCQTPAKGKYDLVIASPGGYPKDINLYQAQKGLSHASLITRDGGTVILAAECAEGVGSSGYEKFMAGVTTSDQVFDKIKAQGFSVGPHKAIQFARELKRIQLVIVSNIPAATIRGLLLTPAATIEEAIHIATGLTPGIEKVGVLPKAINTIPIIR